MTSSLVDSASLPALSGVLRGLKLLDVSDLPRYKAALAAGEQLGFGYYFPYLLTNNRPGRSAALMAEDAGSLCLYLWASRGDRSRLDLLFPPVPFHPGALERALERANDFNGDRSARVKRIDEKDATLVTAMGSLRVKPRRSQYLCAPANYRDLAGGKNQTIRRNVAMVEKLPDVRVVPFGPENLDDCRALITRWQDAHRAAHGTSGGAGISRRFLGLAGTLPPQDMRGEVVLIDGRVVAYAIGGETRPGLGCSFERKCDTGIRGLSYFQLRRLFLLLGDDCELVNDGSDTGREGLRQLKESFRPVKMHLEFRASQRRR